MWNQEDRNNLKSIARSLEILVERDRGRAIPDITSPKSFREIFQEYFNKPIKVTEGPSPQEIAIEEEIAMSQRISNKVAEAQRNGNTPFFSEALLDDEELESL